MGAQILRLLGLAVLRFRFALDRFHTLKWPIGIAARAQPDQRVAARECADQIGDEGAVIGKRRRGGLAEKVGGVHPETVGEDIRDPQTTTILAGPSVCAP